MFAKYLCTMTSVHFRCINTGDVVVDKCLEDRVMFKIYSRFIYIVMFMLNLYVIIYNMI